MGGFTNISSRHKKDCMFFCACVFSSLLFVFLILSLIFGVVYDGYTAVVHTKVFVGSSDFSSLEKKYDLKDLNCLLGDSVAKNGWVLASTDVDLYVKDILFRHKGFCGQLSKENTNLIKKMRENGDIRLFFNTHFFTKGDSVDPQKAGILVSLLGSLITILISVVFIFPIGIITGIYIGGFSNNKKINSLIDLGVKTLASVPSVIIGIFGFTIYIKYFGLPRSSSLVGGLTLGIIALPLIVITTKQALATVPNSIRYTALSMGASPFYVLWRHSIPMSISSIITGFILSIARIIGETAPLLIVGMVVFTQVIPDSVFDSTTTLPAQIYLWSKNPRYGFSELTSFAVLVLISIISCLNILAGYIKKKYSRKYYA